MANQLMFPPGTAFKTTTGARNANGYLRFYLTDTTTVKHVYDEGGSQQSDADGYVQLNSVGKLSTQLYGSGKYTILNMDTGKTTTYETVDDYTPTSGPAGDNTTYIRAETGASETDVQTLLRLLRATPQDFGAVGDGATDDSTAFEALRDSGKAAFIPAAHYVLGSQKIIWIDDVVAEKGAFTSGGHCRGCGYSSDGSAESTTPKVAFKDATHAPAGRLWFPSYYQASTDVLTAMTEKGVGVSTGSDTIRGSSVSYHQLGTQTSIADGESTYRWIESPAQSGEWYCELSGGGDPSISDPTASATEGYVFINGAIGTVGTVGSLSVGEYDYGNNDSLGFNTIYVRITGDGDPDSEASGYVKVGYHAQTNKIAIPGARTSAGTGEEINAYQDLAVRLFYDGLHPLTYRFDFFDNGGNFISSLTSSPFGASGDGRDSVNPMWVCLQLLASQIPEDAQQFELQILDQIDGNTKFYSIETRVLTGPESAARHPGYANLPFKGWSTNKLDSRFNWFNPNTGGGNGSTLTFKEVYDQLRAQMIRYQGNGYRLTVGLDDGWNPAVNSGLYNASTNPYDAVSTRNLRFVLSACELLELKFVPVLLYPSSDSSDTNFPILTMQTNTATQDTYEEAVKDFITECEKWDCVWGYDLISEVAFSCKNNTPESPPATPDYTQTQILDNWNVLQVAARTKTEKPMIMSMSDGFEGPMSMGEVDWTKVDAVDYHGYNNPWRFVTARWYPTGFIPLTMELGFESAGTDDAEANESEQAIYEAAAFACTGWAWAPRFYDDGSSNNNATALARYQES